MNHSNTLLTSRKSRSILYRLAVHILVVPGRVKYSFRVLNNKPLIYEEFSTLPVHVDINLNSGPLSLMTNRNDLEKLTPGQLSRVRNCKNQRGQNRWSTEYQDQRWMWKSESISRSHWFTSASQGRQHATLSKTQRSHPKHTFMPK